ncbi:10304_t:CDS:2 [Cetraspora pellucida]|uniref:10304_t:CDS:1 n=1 Tax=Cetraspora pellucida TaxID=1433469 RepID=A0A9N9A6H3_9GLOM|nr:10304_t:CDS:2 [Cetraspora pellucida]
MKEILQEQPQITAQPQTPQYNIAEDLLNQCSNATYVQMLQISKQYKNLTQPLHCPIILIAKTNLIDSKPNFRTTATKYYIQIKNNSILVILDSGAAVSILSKKLIDKLRLKIEEPLNAIVVITNRSREQALEKIENVRLAVRSILVPPAFNN